MKKINQHLLDIFLRSLCHCLSHCLLQRLYTCNCFFSPIPFFAFAFSFFPGICLIAFGA